MRVDLLLLCCVSALACGDASRAGTDAREEAEAPIVVVDDAGDTIRLDTSATRVVSLVPSVTDVVLALGLEQRLIARTDYDLDPRIAGLPSVGPGLTPNLEWLASQAPDLVIAWRDVEGRALVEQLADVGIPVYSSRLEDVPTVLSTIARVATMLGEPARGDSMRAALAARIDSVRAATRGRPPVRVLYLVGGDPPYAAGPGTFVDQLLDIAGGVNALADLHDGWHSISIEEIVRRDPDMIVIPVHGTESGTAAALVREPGWRGLRATRTGNVHEVDGELFGRPGPRLDRAAAALADLLGGAGARERADGNGA